MCIKIFYFLFKNKNYTRVNGSMHRTFLAPSKFSTPDRNLRATKVKCRDMKRMVGGLSMATINVISLLAPSGIATAPTVAPTATFSVVYGMPWLAVHSDY